jgi:hypothetical protein
MFVHLIESGCRRLFLEGLVIVVDDDDDDDDDDFSSSPSLILFSRGHCSFKLSVPVGEVAWRLACAPAGVVR